MNSLLSLSPLYRFVEASIVLIFGMLASVIGKVRRMAIDVSRWNFRWVGTFPVYFGTTYEGDMKIFG